MITNYGYNDILNILNIILKKLKLIRKYNFQKIRHILLMRTRIPQINSNFENKYLLFLGEFTTKC